MNLEKLIAKAEYDGKCPYCGSRNLEVKRQYSDDSQINLEMICIDCEKEYDLYYDFALIQYEEEDKER